jgi:Leucine-rich repeat (LRR) protein
MDLSNSKNLKMTPCFEGLKNLEWLDLTGCINLLVVDASIGLLTELVFLSLQNCSSLVSLSLGSVSRLCSLRILRLSGCAKLDETPDFIEALHLEYLDMDQCTSLSMIHESIGTLAKLRFLSLRDCIELVRIPDNFNKMDPLISIDLSFCHIFEVSSIIGDLRSLERLNLQGNNISKLPSSMKRLYHLAYLNLSHCHKLQYLPDLPMQSVLLDSVGRYFKTTSGSRDHRSGLYIFDCPMIVKDTTFEEFDLMWLLRLVKVRTLPSPSTL